MRFSETKTRVGSAKTGWDLFVRNLFFTLQIKSLGRLLGRDEKGETMCFSKIVLFTLSWSLLKLVSIESVMPSSQLILSHSLLLLPSVFPVSGSFPMSQLFASGGPSIGASASASFLPMNIQG